jgi:uncharacterized protein
MRTILLLIIMLWVGTVPALAGSDPQFPTETLAIRTSDTLKTFTVEIARTREEQEQGLMNRKSLPDDCGMLFINIKDHVMKMWMKDTLIPLDMLFIDNEGRIVYIAEETTPNSTAVISAKRPVRAVLELPGGAAKKQHISVGDHVIHRYFNP